MKFDLRRYRDKARDNKEARAPTLVMDFCEQSDWETKYSHFILLIFFATLSLFLAKKFLAVLWITPILNNYCALCNSMVFQTKPVLDVF